MQYNIHRPWETLDDWQKEYIESETDCILVAGRQVGKTTAMSIKIGERARKKKSDILIGALTEKQAYQLYFKALTYLIARYPKEIILKGADKPTKHEFRLKNGSIVRSYALGLTGMGMRTFTITDLFIDEAREIGREVFVSLEPMLSVTKGTRDYASTPGGKIGYFYEMSKPEFGFKKFHVAAHDCPRHTKEFLEMQQKNMSRLEYAQEYLGQFLDEVMRVYGDKLLSDCCTLTRRSMIYPNREYFAGVDVGRMGDGKSTFEIFDATKIIIEQVENMTTEKEFTTQTASHISALQQQYKCQLWGIDGGGVGGGVIDQCFTIAGLGEHRIVDLNNAAKRYKIRDEDRTLKNVLKTEMHVNLLRMMEQGKVRLLNDENLIKSLSSVFFEYDEEGKMSIFASDNHIVEGVVRGVFLAVKEKSLNLSVHTIRI